MAQKWYQKATVQAAFAAGVFVLLAAIVTPLVSYLLSEESIEVPRNEVTHTQELLDQKSVSELIKLLQHRAERIRNELISCYEKPGIDSLLYEFGRLHDLHISALQGYDFILAHETLKDIRNLSNWVSEAQLQIGPLASSNCSAHTQADSLIKNQKEFIRGLLSNMCFGCPDFFLSPGRVYCLYVTEEIICSDIDIHTLQDSASSSILRFYDKMR